MLNTVVAQTLSLFGSHMECCRHGKCTNNFNIYIYKNIFLTIFTNHTLTDSVVNKNKQLLVSNIGIWWFKKKKKCWAELSHHAPHTQHQQKYLARPCFVLTGSLVRAGLLTLRPNASSWNWSSWTTRPAKDLLEGESFWTCWGQREKNVLTQSDKNWRHKQL